MSIPGKIASLLLAAFSKLMSVVKTLEARNSASLGLGTKIGDTGRVINISGQPERIRVGNNGFVKGELLTFAHAGKIEIGDWFYIGPNSTIWSSDEAGIKIGNRVLVSMGVNIHDTNSHPLDPVERFKQTQQILTSGHSTSNPGIKSAPVVIGDDVWIGLGATILKGVTIGDRAIIGAHAIVTSDVPADGFVPTPKT
jgi:acetyltransferase-like isoleucine patch superfamily enzyme